MGESQVSEKQIKKQATIQQPNPILNAEFIQATKKILTVSKAELKHREDEWKQAREKLKRQRKST